MSMQSDDPDVKRDYDNATRQQQSEQTRQRVLEEARRLLLERGYRATTVAAIADAAGVNADTVYRLVGRKPVLLRALIEQAISGSDEAVDAEQRDYVVAIRSEPDPVRKLEIYASATCGIHERLAPLLLALRDAATTEPEAADVWRDIGNRRAANMRRFVADLQAVTTLRDGLDVDTAADTVWATNSAEMYVMLTSERGWPPARYEAWLVDMWSSYLFADRPPREV